MKYKKGYKYILAEEFKFNLGNNFPDVNTDFVKIKKGIITLKKGYAWDGATGDRDTKNMMKGSLVHDALYQLISMGEKVDRKQADDMFRKINLSEGMSKFRAWYTWKAVRMFGHNFIKPKKIYSIK